MLARTALRRIFLGVLTLLLVSIVVFVATRLLPGDAAQAVLGRSSTPARLSALRGQLGLDRPVLSQYGSMVSGIVTGHPGRSLSTGQPVLQLVGPRLVNSLWLLLVASLVSIPVALAMGIIAAARQGRPVDRILSTVSLAAAAVPEFVVAIALVILLAVVVLHLFPPVSLVAPDASVWADPSVLVLPCLSLIIVATPYMFRMTRASMIEILQSDYVEMARIKGVSDRVILIKHALPNALAPIIQSIALTLAYLAGGVVVIEYVFGYPGIGQGLVNAVSLRDLSTLQFIVLVLATFYVLVNITADLVAILVTPRLRTRTATLELDEP
ncbi:MAG: ABC transporter permease [Solirubrobacteraceae bacterium]